MILKKIRGQKNNPFLSITGHGQNLNTLRYMLFNPWSIVNKVHDIMSNLSDKNIDIAAFCETWLADMNNPTTAIIKSFGYKIHHNFRTDKKGGGTALVYKGVYTMSYVQSSTVFSTFEHTMASMKTATGTKVLFVTMYRPGSLTSMFFQELDKLLSEILIIFH